MHVVQLVHQIPDCFCKPFVAKLNAELLCQRDIILFAG